MDWEVAGSPGSKAQNVQPDSKGKKKKRKVLIVALVMLALVVAGNLVHCVNSAPKDLNWPSTGMATLLPKPDSGKGEVQTNSDSSLYVKVSNYDESKYSKYVEACKEKGFTIEAKSETKSYEAYSEDGHHLKLSFYSDDMTIDLDAPLEMSALSWPTSGPGSLLPKPISDKGSVSANSSSQFTVTVGETSQQDFATYVEECSKAGFNVDFSKSDTVYQAENGDGTKVYVKYEGFNQMSVSVYAAKDSASTSQKGDSASSTPTDIPAQSETSASSGDSSLASGVTPSFKETMDGYEEFMNQYVDFMVKYQDGGSTAAMLADYGKMVAKEAEWLNTIDTIDEDSLSDADLAYYLEVTGRVTEKLASIA